MAGISCSLPGRQSGSFRRASPLPCRAASPRLLASRPVSRRPRRRGATVLFASGADLQSINPLLTLHPLARQVQRYVLLTTLARYDSALTPQPYLARELALVRRIGARSRSSSSPASAGTTARRPPSRDVAGP